MYVFLKLLLKGSQEHSQAHVQTLSMATTEFDDDRHLASLEYLLSGQLQKKINQTNTL